MVRIGWWWTLDTALQVTWVSEWFNGLPVKLPCHILECLAAYAYQVTDWLEGQDLCWANLCQNWGCLKSQRWGMFVISLQILMRCVIVRGYGMGSICWQSVSSLGKESSSWSHCTWNWIVLVLWRYGTVSVAFHYSFLWGNWLFDSALDLHRNIILAWFFSVGMYYGWMHMSGKMSTVSCWKGYLWEF